MRRAFVLLFVMSCMIAGGAAAQTTRCGWEIGQWVCRQDPGVQQQEFRFADVPNAFNEGREAALRQQLLEEQVRQARLATQQMQNAAPSQYAPNTSGLSPQSAEEILFNERLNVSEARAKSVHGGAIVERAKDWFHSLRQAFPEKANAISTSSDPYEMLLTEYAKVGGK